MDLRQVITEEDREKIYSLRYEVYITEMERSTHNVDHKRKQLYDELDDTGYIFGAFVDGEAVGTLRFNCSVNTEMGEYETLYSMDCVDDHHPAHTSVCTKFIIKSAYRNTSLAPKLILQGYMASLELGITNTFLDCNAHLIPLYSRLGFITYKDDVSSKEYGMVTPMILNTRDISHFKTIRSPLLRVLKNYESGLLEEYKQIYHQDAEDHYQDWATDENLHETKAVTYIFDKFSDNEIRTVVRMSSQLYFKEGELIIEAGEEGYDLKIILDGQAAVTRETSGGQVVLALFSRGQVVGEVGFLKKLPRTATVKALSDCKVLNLSSVTINKMLIEEKDIAIKLFQNLATILASRLSKTTDNWMDAYE